MKLVKTLGLAALGVSLATGAMAHSHYKDSVIHGHAHHTHEYGNWHGVKPHKHNGKWTHRGHSHQAPVVEKQCRPSVCDLKNWKSNYDLQRCRVKNAGKHSDYYSYTQ